jgi:hypothetical protein|tara:strand:+ start:1013 stop:1147 length:135 start_codon:yes stop_codon:yes gene_type:complete
MDLEEKREDLDQLTPALSAVEQAIGKYSLTQNGSLISKMTDSKI